MVAVLLTILARWIALLLVTFTFFLALCIIVLACLEVVRVL